MGERKKETYREYFKYFAVDFAIFAQKKVPENVIFLQKYFPPLSCT
jgi:hypothetical protein